MKLLFGLIVSAFGDGGDRDDGKGNFIPPEQRFDFNQMEREVREDPNNPGNNIEILSNYIFEKFDK